MAEHILLMNPRRKGGRRRRRGSARKGVVPPQLRPYLFGRRHKKHAHRENPRRHKSHRRNPRRSHAIVMRPRYRRRGNPRSLFGGSGMSSIKKQVIGAGVGITGAIVMDVAWSKLRPRLPASMQSGYMASAVEAGAVLALGWGLGKYVMPRQKEEIRAGVVGALTVIGFQVLYPLISAKLGLSGLGAYMAPPGAAMLPAPAAVRHMPLADYSAYRLTSPAPGVQNAAAAIRGNMSPGVGGVAGYIPDSMG